MITFKNSTTYSGKRIEVFDEQNIFNINIEYYEKDNIFEMDNLKILHLQNSLLPLHYEFRCFKARKFDTCEISKHTLSIGNA